MERRWSSDALQVVQGQLVLHIPGVARTRGFDRQDVDLSVSNRQVLSPSGNDEELTLVDDHIAAAQCRHG